MTPAAATRWRSIEPASVQLAMDAMRSWVMRTGIDGFRFDLAPVMGRTASGFDVNAPLLAAIEQDPAAVATSS